METRKRNYKSDFDFIFDLGYYDDNGEFVSTGWPPYDFELHFYTGQVLRNYVVKCIGGVATNCFNDNGEVHVVANNHGLGLGVLNVEGVLYLPNDIYPDGSQKIVEPQALDIELVKGAGDNPVSTFRARLAFPVIKEKGRVTSVPSDNVIGDIEPNIVRDALRKTPQELSEEEKAQILKNLDNPELKVFVSLWNKACGIWGRYNEETGYFELNGLTDITYEQAIAIYQAGPLIDSLDVFGGGVFETIRTNLPSVRESKSPYNGSFVAPYTDAFPVQMEVVNLNPANKEADLYLTNRRFISPISHYTFKTRRYIGVINLKFHSQSDFTALQVGFKVEHLLIRCLHMNANIESARLDIESMVFLVAEATNTSPITITVHPDVYAKLTDENNTEWNKVLVDGAAKNITFATV